MPENVLEQKNETEIQNSASSDAPKAEFDPDKESFLRAQQMTQSATEVNSAEQETQPEATPIEDASTKENTDILNNLAAFDAVENVQEGIERSVVAKNNAAIYLAELDNDTQKAWSEANAELNKISLHRSVIESEFQSALSNFDIAKATALEKQIIDLSKKYAQKQAEANLVNIKLNEQLTKAFASWKKWTAEYLDTIRNEEGYKKAYYIIEQVKSMDKEKAQSLLNEPEIKAHLGVWLDPIKDYVERKEQ